MLSKVLKFVLSSLFQPYLGWTLTSQLYVLKETWVPGENHRLTPKSLETFIHSNILIELSMDNS